MGTVPSLRWIILHIVILDNNFVGHRDDIIAGKEASAQEGFNIGYKQSALFGCRWGLVKGITR